MAASMATSLSSLSHRLSLRPQYLPLLPLKPSSLSFSHHVPSPSPLLSLRCTPPESEASETDPIPEQEQEQDQEQETAALEEEEEEEDGEPPMFSGPLFDWPDETEEESGTAFERLYGPAFSGKSYLGGNINCMDGVLNKLIDEFDNLIITRPVDDFKDRVIQVRRVTKVVKGGKNMSFRAIVVVGDGKGHVGVGVGKALEVAEAVVKAVINGRRNIVTVPLTKHLTFPHRATGKYRAAEVMLRPAAPGSGVIAGGAVRAVLELAGLQNALGKQLGSDNALNNARATIVATQQMRHLADVARERGIPMEELWK
ncbi:hypothetical protein LUZ61_016496 [Rhynchospora tenuis]|uniref:Small ribosomal subunit protein uS5c n=1 Tax=Rhynchospora tenuis TaxID=198213 RepID=A0AAD6EK33_9POAL|nr:hypothetical protein LUZ61_016496 [Rhynchospora tenuis]